MKAPSLYYFKNEPNFGDMLNVLIYEKLVGLPVRYKRYSHADAYFCGSILHQFLDRFSSPWCRRFIRKYMRSKVHVWGTGLVNALPGAHVGEGSITQTGSVVHGEIPSCAIAGGNPAKVFAWRNKEHFNDLKKAEKFYRKEDILK